MESIKTGIRVSGICGNSWGVDIVDWSRDKDIMAVFSFLKLNQLGISWGISFDRLESSGLVLDGLLGDCWDGMDGTKTKTVSPIDKLRSPMGNNSKRGKNNLFKTLIRKLIHACVVCFSYQELHIGLTQSELMTWWVSLRPI